MRATGTNEQRIDGKTAIVTGGSRGIGLGIARAFVAAGANVMITGRKEQALEEATKTIGGNIRYTAGHAGRPEDIEAAVDATIDAFGRVDILVNNAATNPYAGPTIDVDIPRWDKTFETNLRGPLLWSQAAWRKSMQENGGAIINISSVGGFATNRILGVYDVTKAALIALTRQLAAELAPGVRVNAIAPGLIKTDFARVLWEGDRGDQVAKSYPLKRLGEVEDIASGALFLAAETSGWMTGQTLVFDGGGLIKFEG